MVSRRLLPIAHAAALGLATLGASGADAATLDCAIFAFSGGESTINSATSIEGNVCYGAGVVSATNQKAENFDGTVYVHGDATFDYTAKNFTPSGGFVTGVADADIGETEAELLARSRELSFLAATETLADPLILSGGARLTIASDASGPTVVDLSHLDLNGATLRLEGAGPFVFNFRQAAGIDATFDWSQSTIELAGGVTASDVTWNFIDTFDVKINKAETIFAGAILGPNSSVEYHNPAIFEGSISAKWIDVHSDFNLIYAQPVDPITPVPLPGAFWLLCAAIAATMALTRVRDSA